MRYYELGKGRQSFETVQQRVAANGDIAQAAGAPSIGQGISGVIKADSLKMKKINKANTSEPCPVNSDDEKWMRRALALAQEAERQGEVPVGAVLVRDNLVLAEGYNQPISARDPTAHAEVVALRKAAQKIQNYRLVDTTLYVTVEPCSMCAGSLVHARVRRLVFGATEPRAGAVCSRLPLLSGEFLNHKVDVTGGVLAEESAALISNFFAKKRR